jgi:hypothetical protein
MHRRSVVVSLFALFFLAAPARSADAPEAVIRSLIAAHAPLILDVGSGVFDSEEAIRRFFTPPLADAILRSQQRTQDNPGEVVEGVMDFDPITASNAPQMRDLMIEPATVEGDRAHVVTTFLRDAESLVRVRYTLRALNEAWLVDDIAGEGNEEGGGWSLRRVLRMPD